MSIATKNTITNYWVKMENNQNSNNNNLQCDLVQLPLHNSSPNNNLLNNVKLRNMLITNNSLRESELLLKPEDSSLSLGLEKVPIMSGEVKVQNNVASTRKVLVIYTGGTIGMLRIPDSDGKVLDLEMTRSEYYNLYLIFMSFFFKVWFQFRICWRKQ